MSGAIVTIRINGQPYQLGCDKGQEAEIEAYGKTVDEIVTSLAGSVGQIGDMRLLVMASILLAEKAAKSDDRTTIVTPSPANMLIDQHIEKLENLANMISELAASVKPT